MPAKKSQRSREYFREWHRRNPTKVAEYHATYMIKWVRTRMAHFDEYRKTLSCERCGFSDYRALDFHHRDQSQKRFDINYAVRRKPWAEILSEIEKCEVLCANCHRIEHHGKALGTQRDPTLLPHDGQLELLDQVGY